MRVVSRKHLRQFADREPRARAHIEAWYAEAKHAAWKTPAEIKAKYGSASILKAGRVVFNICGNEYRLVVKINYDFGCLYVRFLGTHAEYDKIDANTI
jgi:mRNA interferase HigB